jgi:hypothetical protein
MTDQKKTDSDNIDISPEEARARGLYLHDGRWITLAEAKQLHDKLLVRKDIRRLANFYFILEGLIGIGVVLALVYSMFKGSQVPNPGESLQIAVFGAFCVIALVVGVGLRQLKPWARLLGLVFYPVVMACLFVVAVVAGQLTGKVLAVLVLGLPLTISFGVLSYLTLYGEGSAEAFDQAGDH